MEIVNKMHDKSKNLTSKPIFRNQSYKLFQVVIIPISFSSDRIYYYIINVRNTTLKFVYNKNATL